MKMLIHFLVLGLLLSTLPACVELRDPNKDKSPQIEEQDTHFSELVVDQPLYLVQGRWLTEADIKARLASNQSIDWTPQSYQMTYDKMTFTEQGILYTGGNDLDLTIGELESFHGQLATFPESAQAAVGSPGLSGGLLNLVVRQASGSLTIFMRGQDGGNGQSVPVRSFDENLNCSRPDAIVGENGQEGGRTGKLVFKLNENNPTRFDVYVQKQMGRGGKAGESLQGQDCGAAGVVTHKAKMLDHLPQPGRDGAIERSCVQLGAGSSQQCE